jgi:hypothetical protein
MRRGAVSHIRNQKQQITIITGAESDPAAVASAAMLLLLQALALAPTL